jgi:hypothetical protein
MIVGNGLSGRRTETAIDDALFTAHDVTGRGGVSYRALPYARIESLLKR